MTNGSGTVKSERVLTHTVESPFYTGPLRSPLRIQNTFANECFVDELAAAVNADPVEYRLRHLRNERVRGVLQAVAKAAKWEAQPAHVTPLASHGERMGRGVACVAYEGDNGYAALIAVPVGFVLVSLRWPMLFGDKGSDPDTDYWRIRRP